MKVVRAHKIYAAAIAALSVAAAGVYFFSPRRASFATVAEFREWAKSSGLHVWPEEGGANASIRVSTRPAAEWAHHNPNPVRLDETWKELAVATSTDFSEPHLPYRQIGGVRLVGDPLLLEKVLRMLGE